MRYLTKKLIVTERFYDFVRSYCSYKEAMDSYCHAVEDGKLLSDDEKYFIYAQAYNNHIKCAEQTIKGDYQKIYKGELLRTIIYGDDGTLRPLDEILFNELWKINRDLIITYGQVGKPVSEEANIIRNGKFPRTLKNLAILNKHDANVVFEKVGDNKIQIFFKDYGYDYNEKYIFNLANNQDIFFSDNSLYDHATVLYEELFRCENNVFEYNVLLQKLKGSDIFDFEETSILFTEVEVRKIKCRK